MAPKTIFPRNSTAETFFFFFCVHKSLCKHCFGPARTALTCGSFNSTDWLLSLCVSQSICIFCWQSYCCIRGFLLCSRGRTPVVFLRKVLLLHCALDSSSIRIWFALILILLRFDSNLLCFDSIRWFQYEKRTFFRCRAATRGYTIPYGMFFFPTPIYARHVSIVPLLTLPRPLLLRSAGFESDYSIRIWFDSMLCCRNCSRQRCPRCTGLYLISSTVFSPESWVSRSFRLLFVINDKNRIVGTTSSSCIIAYRRNSIVSYWVLVLFCDVSRPGGC